MSKRFRILINSQTGEVILPRVKLCKSFFCHAKGLMLTFRLPEDRGLLFVTKREGKSHTTITMLFMFYSIAVIWLDAEMRVVDKQLAQPWRLAYVPGRAAQYYLEARPHVLERVSIGDILSFDEEAG